MKATIRVYEAQDRDGRRLSQPEVDELGEAQSYVLISETDVTEILKQKGQVIVGREQPVEEQDAIMVVAALNEVADILDEPRKYTGVKEKPQADIFLPLTSKDIREAKPTTNISRNALILTDSGDVFAKGRTQVYQECSEPRTTYVGFGEMLMTSNAIDGTPKSGFTYTKGTPQVWGFNEVPRLVVAVEYVK